MNESRASSRQFASIRKRAAIGSNAAVASSSYSYRPSPNWIPIVGIISTVQLGLGQATPRACRNAEAVGRRSDTYRRMRSIASDAARTAGSPGPAPCIRQHRDAIMSLESVPARIGQAGVACSLTCFTAIWRWRWHGLNCRKKARPATRPVFGYVQAASQATR